MFVITCAVLVVAVASAAGFMLGARYAAKQIADRLKNDPEYGIPMLEVLASRFGARLEMFKGMGAAVAPDDKGPAR